MINLCSQITCLVVKVANKVVIIAFEAFRDSACLSLCFAIRYSVIHTVEIGVIKAKSLCFHLTIFKWPCFFVIQQTYVSQFNNVVMSTLLVVSQI